MHQIFCRLVDPESFHVALSTLSAAHREATYEKLGVLSLFHPDNPTGKYDLILGQQAHYMIASRLLKMFREQYDDGLCSLPTLTCAPHFRINEELKFITDPHTVELPREGRLEVSFVLRNRQIVNYKPVVWLRTKGGGIQKK